MAIIQMLCPFKEPLVFFTTQYPSTNWPVSHHLYFQLTLLICIFLSLFQHQRLAQFYLYCVLLWYRIVCFSHQRISEKSEKM
jgi:hypothetical protein